MNDDDQDAANNAEGQLNKDTLGSAGGGMETGMGGGTAPTGREGPLSGGTGSGEANQGLMGGDQQTIGQNPTPTDAVDR